MKAKHVFILSALFLTATLPGFSQAVWYRPASPNWGQSNSNTIQQIFQISNMMAIANSVSNTNPELAKQEAQKALEQIQKLPNQDTKDYQKSMKDMIDSIIKFLIEMEQAKVEQMHSMTRV